MPRARHVFSHVPGTSQMVLQICDMTEQQIEDGKLLFEARYLGVRALNVFQVFDEGCRRLDQSPDTCSSTESVHSSIALLDDAPGLKRLRDNANKSQYRYELTCACI